jgi:hypothetical protein
VIIGTDTLLVVMIEALMGRSGERYTYSAREYKMGESCFN